MKALRLALVAAILSVAVLSYAGERPGPPITKNVVKITLRQAITHPGLVNAMYDQLSIGMLQVEPQGQYVGTVVYSRVIFKIYGTREAWVRFFLSKPKTKGGTKILHE